MKKIALSLISIALAAVCFTSCQTTAAPKGFSLGHFDGSDTSNGYDTDLLYRNNSDFWGGDSGVLYVSEEEDPEYGGYFYQYMSGCSGVGADQDDGYVASIAVSRSKDLNDWTTCGVVEGGYSLITYDNEWVEYYIWAPEVVIAPCDCTGDCTVNYHGKYFMYFTAATPVNDGSNPEANYFNSTSWQDRLNLGIAISDTPVGPFRLVTSENVYGDENAENPNGKVVTSVNPSISMREEFDLNYEWSAIDMHPFFDDNGELYLYFTRHVTDNFTRLMNPLGRRKAYWMHTWGIKMKDMITPDYSTLTKLVANGAYTTCEYVGDEQVTYTTDGTYFYDYWDLYNDATTALTATDAGNGVKKINVVLSYEEDGKTVAETMDHYIKSTDGGETYLAYSDAACTKPIIGYENGARYHDYNYKLTYSYPDGSVNTDDHYDEDSADGNVVEAPQILTTKNAAGETVYLLTYSAYGVSSSSYDVRYAYAKDPLGTYQKPKKEDGNTLLGLDDKNDFMTNLGHVQFLDIDDELWCVHWECLDPGSNNVNPGRIYALTQMSWIDAPSLGFSIPVAKGPSNTLQPLPSIYTGYRNVADRATITATNVKGDSIKYLNDGLVVTQELYSDMEFHAKGKTTITLTFDEPVAIRGIFIYNSYDYYCAFSKIDTINFTLAESPAFYDGVANTCYIQNLGIPESSIDDQYLNIRPGSAALATFYEIKVTKIEIVITSNVANNPTDIGVSDIYVMGK